MTAPRAGEVYFEHRAIGRQVKVSAIDGATGAEVSIVGPVSADRRALEALALRKLRTRLNAAAPGGEGAPPVAGGGRFA